MGGWSSVTCEAVGALPLVLGIPEDAAGLEDSTEIGRGGRGGRKGEWRV